MTADDLHNRTSSETVAAHSNEPNRTLRIEVAFSLDATKMDALADFNLLTEIRRTEECVKNMECLGNDVLEPVVRIVISDYVKADSMICWLEKSDMQSARKTNEFVSHWVSVCAGKYVPDWERKGRVFSADPMDYVLYVDILMDFAFNNDYIPDASYKRYIKNIEPLLVQIQRFQTKCEFLSRYGLKHHVTISLFENNTEPDVNSPGDYEIKRTALITNKWNLTGLNTLYMKLCQKYSLSSVIDTQTGTDIPTLITSYVSPVIKQAYILMHRDDPDYKFWMIGYKSDYKKNIHTLYLFLRPWDTTSKTTTRITRMTEWINTHLVDVLSASDIQQMCGSNSQTTVELRVCVGSDFVPVNDRKDKLLHSRRYLKPGTKTDIVFKISWHDGSFSRFGHSKPD